MSTKPWTHEGANAIIAKIMKCKTRAERAAVLSAAPKHLEPIIRKVVTDEFERRKKERDKAKQKKAERFNRTS